MNEQEAIETILYASAFNREDSPLTQALDMATKALEKQIAKNPIKYPVLSIHTYPSILYIPRCPKCDRVVDEYRDEHIFPQTRNKFCSFCGQKLLWEDEE
jgi:hypothetical protein